MYLADLFAAGLAIGCVYSLVALGFAMIIRATGIIHFAQGELLMLGSMSALSTLWLMSRLPAVLVLACGMLASGVLAVAMEFLVPAGLRHYRSDIEEQTRFTMQILTEQLEANETDWAHCHHVRLYLTEPRRDYRAFARVWREYFPDPARAPALAFVPSTGIMFEGPVIEIDPTCVVRG